MRGWASSTLLGAGRREWVVRSALAVVLVSVTLWALPVRRPGDEGGHHAEPAPTLDAFERAGITEFTAGQRGPAFRLETLAVESEGNLAFERHRVDHMLMQSIMSALVCHIVLPLTLK